MVRTLNPRRTLASAKVNRQPAPLLALLWIGEKSPRTQCVEGFYFFRSWLVFLTLQVLQLAAQLLDFFDQVCGQCCQLWVGIKAVLQLRNAPRAHQRLAAETP